MTSARTGRRAVKGMSEAGAVGYGRCWFFLAVIQDRVDERRENICAERNSSVRASIEHACYCRQLLASVEQTWARTIGVNLIVRSFTCASCAVTGSSRRPFEGTHLARFTEDGRRSSHAASMVLARRYERHGSHFRARPWQSVCRHLLFA